MWLTIGGYLLLSKNKTNIIIVNIHFKITLARIVVICQLYFSVELAMIMDRLYGGVCYAGIDVDPELKYPKGSLFILTRSIYLLEILGKL